MNLEFVALRCEQSNLRLYIYINIDGINKDSIVEVVLIKIV